ncbi:MAG TPA: ATP-binding protein [Cyclobacteriaceae bacterium]|nr:ATP-binding protein [Cyclobacteriaceae bacterium]
METSKEEVESTNEELTTINAELQSRNDQLSESYEYSSGIFDIIREGVFEPKRKSIIDWDLDPTVRYVEIIVSDKGIGFSEHYKEKIFEIFHRLNSTQDYPGTGIGLALCRKIVTNHGGKIFAESAEMAGTEFHVILPYMQLKDVQSK